MGLEWRVGELAARRGWGAAQLARSTGLDVKTARNLITGRPTRVDLETIARLANALEVIPGPLWRSSTDGAVEHAWRVTAGAVGRSDRAELDDVLSGDWDGSPDPALERATRPR
jgi:DNA-binding Xre family transcriptional regulator